MYCKNCGKDNPDNSRFCSSCGFMLVPQEKSDESAPQAVPVKTTSAAPQAVPVRAAGPAPQTVPVRPADPAPCRQRQAIRDE